MASSESPPRIHRKFHQGLVEGKKRMHRSSNIPLRAVTTLILLFYGNAILAQREDRRPLSSPDVGWKITTESGSRSAMRIVCGYGETFTKSESYYTCCPTSAESDCALPTTCSGNTLLYPGDKKKDCESNACASILIYESAPSENLLGTQLVCRYGQLGDSSPWTAYRNFPDTTASATQSTKTNAAPASSTTLARETNSGSSDSPSRKKSSSSKAWIAGAVIGVIAGAVLIGVLGFCIARRKFRQKPSSSKDDDTVPVVDNASAGGIEDADSIHTKAAELHNYDRAELHFEQRPVELSHFGTNVVEMPVQHDRRIVAELDGAPVRRGYP
ncbi:hypothetical protein AJ79_08803 [Helicocarpus griseus UAMH5409]|uniref:Uncharacterized protein n=1 Tax=Helicocarpus griseus UAMH5409 TaxID=1447875 RepID=A0A2B7WPZ1_9EURO|nr:hypothetical protein AJ79_08803 [Helicocarpus griseus UAMH5409]